METYTNPIFRLVVIEPDEALFYRICCEQDVTDLIASEKLLLVVGDESEDETVIDRLVEDSLQIYNSNHCVLFAMPGFEEVYDTSYSKLSVAIEKKQRHLKVAYDSVSDSKNQRCLNTLHALSVLRDNYTIGDFFGAVPTKEIPVIIVASGPSLAKNIDLLKRAYGKAIIVTLAHSAKTVHDSGCDIDILAVKDAQLGQPFLEFEKAADAIMIMRVGAARDIQKKYNGHILFYGFDNNLFPCAEKEAVYTTKKESGSVAGDIFYMFVAAGFQNIILIGQDLAYDNDGFTHAGGEKNYGVNDTDRIETEDIYGNKIYTRADWQIMREYYEGVIKEHPELTVIDATEGGVYIQGTKICPFEQAIEEYCSTRYPVQTWLRGMKRSQQSVDTKEIFQKRYDATVRVEEKIRNLLKLNENIQMEIGKYKRVADVEILENYDKEFTGLLQCDDAELLWIYSENVIMYYMSGCVDAEKKKLVEKVRYESAFISRLLDGCQELKKCLSCYLDSGSGKE
ncbi:MAG: motility associated factor glycosyltransferase family protein [Lachnospiraceae bacterium]|nr:motility associated factor glycosyltransferase family protein [Lachnospiraceae bacterium]